MKQRLTWIMASFLFGILVFGSGCASAAELKALVPTERAVYQRNDKNQTDMTVRAQYEEGKSVTANLMAADGSKLSEEIALTASADDGTIYEGTIPGVPAGGWYQLELVAKDSSSDEAEASATVENIGVGEVFITGGQSNSCNFGWTKTVAEEDMVSAFDPKTDSWVHCEDPQPCISGFSDGNGKGSPWPSTGDALYAKLQVPIGFITTGFGGSTIAELLEKHYTPIKDAIESLRPYGCRAFLLHQGEGDSGIKTKQADYAAALKDLISQTREDAGYDLVWMVANAAYTNYTSLEAEAEILNAQKEVCDEETIFLGPYTDDMTKATGHRGRDDLHFSEEGLKEHGLRWADAISEKLIPDYSKLIETPAPTATPSATETPVPSTAPATNPPASSTTTPAPTASPVISSSPAPTEKPASNKGKVFKKGIFQYKITSGKKVKLTAINGKTKKSIVIAKKVKYQGVSYQVSAIDKKALKKLKKLKKLKVPSSLYKASKAALKGKKVTIKKY